nr:hypothetical protein Iba_chr01bCG3940 [Ipomoea batatas]
MPHRFSGEWGFEACGIFTGAKPRRPPGGRPKNCALGSEQVSDAYGGELARDALKKRAGKFKGYKLRVKAVTVGCCISYETAGNCGGQSVLQDNALRLGKWCEPRPRKRGPGPGHSPSGEDQTPERACGQMIS